MYTRRSESTEEYQVDTRPQSSGWSSQFSFRARQASSIFYSTMYFVYDTNKNQTRSLIDRLVLNQTNYLPVDFFFATKEYEPGLDEVFLRDRGLGTPLEISLETSFTCCGTRKVASFYVNVTLEGWYSLGRKCLTEDAAFHFPSLIN